MPALRIVLASFAALSALVPLRQVSAPASHVATGSRPSLDPDVVARTVISNERGSIYAPPSGGAWAGIGAYVGDPKTRAFWQMAPGALKIAQGKFHVFRPSDDTTWSYFPYSKLRAYDASETAAGRPSLFITATYAGKSRPVLWNWSLGFPSQGSAPTTDPSQWEYAVNVGDPRFVHFWITNYADPILLHQYYGARGHSTSITRPYPEEWIGLDEAAFNYRNYGVLDDANHWVGGVRWDPPFPQGSAGMHRMFQQFFAQLKQERPDIHIMANLGTMDDWGYFRSDFANVDGLMLEDILSGNREDPSGSARGQFYDRYLAFTWWAAQGRVAVLRSRIDTDAATFQDDLRTSYVAYLIYRGSNFFFAPQSTVTGDEIAPGDYAAMKRALGLPVAPPTAQQAAGQSGRGYRLYSRQTQDGIVYLNYTGSSQAITLPAGHTYYDHNGDPVTRITIPDLAGDYVTFSNAAPRPAPTRTPVPSSATGAPTATTVARPAVARGHAPSGAPGARRSCPPHTCP